MGNNIFNVVFKFCYRTIAPLLSITLLLNTFLVLGAILFWKMPAHPYIPFTTGPIASFVERLFFLFGLIYAIFSDYED